MNSNDPRSMKELVSKLINQLGINDQILVQKIKSEWQDIVGDIAYQRIQVLDLKNGVLHLSSSTSVWNNEFRLRKFEIIQKINDRYHSQIVSDITIS